MATKIKSIIGGCVSHLVGIEAIIIRYKQSGLDSNIT